MNNTGCGNPEILEEWDWEHGLPTGESVSREIAHREGTPHEAVHLWIARDLHRGPRLLFQLRASHKDNYPGCLDITVGGHVPYGYIGDKLRKEACEEIGIDPPAKKRIDLGWYRYEEKSEGLFQRELQHVYLLHDDRPLNSYRFRDGEVSGIFAVTLDDVKAVLRGSDTAFTAEGFTGTGVSGRSLSSGDFHPQLLAPAMDAYMGVVIRAVEELAETGRVTTRLSEL